MSMIIDIVKQSKISLKERDQMYSVFSRYYDNVDCSRFKKDLDSKNWVILLRNLEGDIVGFSTLQIYKHSFGSEIMTILYSGDTIVDRPYRTNGDLAGAFGHILLKTINENREKSVYWLLTSKGVRTYRFLPVFFNDFFPVYDRDTSKEIKKIIDGLASAKFGDNYSPETHVISHDRQLDRLCASEQDPLLLSRSDPHVSFFLKQNPGHIEGDELTCLTPISEDNLNSRALRVIKHTKVNWRE